MTRTRLTKTGQPVLGTTLSIQLTDGTQETATVVGKGIGTDGYSLVCVWVEWADGTRQQLPWDGLEWQSVDGDRPVRPEAWWDAQDDHADAYEMGDRQ